MQIRFIHTSDWQIGKVFRFMDSTAMGLLQEARLQAITRIGEFAGEHAVRHVLVAGDVYDMEALPPRSLNQPLERMRSFTGVQWHLLPGNHDPHRPNGLWDRLLGKGLPENVHAHVAPEPMILEEIGAALLPAPLHYRRTLDDPTAYMDEVELPDGFVRIGLAHGTVTGFGSDDRETPNYIDPDRPKRAGLAYLALGDWHGQKKINDRCWYSGTPETDAFDVIDGGRALLVEIEGPAAPPTVTPVPTGRYTWTHFSERINRRKDIDFLAEKLRGSADELDRVLVHLTVAGALSLEDRQYFQDQIEDGVSAAFCFMRVDDRQLFSRPTAEDLDRIDRGGFVRMAAEKLMQQIEEGGKAERELAAEALQRLYIEHMKLQASQR
ncbi:metallophosphoesterase family protein [Methylohalobius crimeensis]|uniref:metallophosphoesterase family protein n=1 Tax=Methylohalobius crimeensis TaxID=244365 RepID=UPI0003B417FC|nr:metallophosphoesterase [Methylohalobius crimeensis]